MKRIKKAALLAAAALVLASAAGCSQNDNSEIVGSWAPATATISGSTVTCSELGIEDGSFELDFYDNGDCRVILAGMESDGTYTFNGTSVDIVTGDKEQKLDYTAGMITLYLDYDNNNSMQLTFTKAD